MESEITTNKQAYASLDACSLLTNNNPINEDESEINDKIKIVISTHFDV